MVAARPQLIQVIPRQIANPRVPLPIKSDYVRAGASRWLFSIIQSLNEKIFDCAGRKRAFGNRLDFSVKRSAFSNVIDRKSTRLNSSHLGISYAVFCLKKK